ncbi:MAG: molybdenum cofactor guanylyltransferase [Pseudomonadales bacterium]|nr:molybdenum cofactor guanylyltransferase [Pseudomonadales bacterium]
MKKTAELSALILAGGRATRMQEQDKGLLLFNKKPLVSYLIDRFSPQLESISISCNRNFEQYQQFGYPLVRDQQSDFAGPLAGIDAGLSACTTPYMLVIPCDMPLLPEDLIGRLWQPIVDCADDGIITVADDGQQLQVLVMILPVECRPSIQQYLETGQRSVHGWLKTQSVTRVLFNDAASSFININSLAELTEQESAHD